MNNPIRINHKPDIDTLVKVSKFLFWRMPFVKLLPVFLIVFISLREFPKLLDQNSNIQDPEWSDVAIQFICIIFVWILIYFFIISGLKKNILNNKRNLESQTIVFDSESFTQQGETFKIENFWNETYQIQETNKWLLIYPKKNSALPILKSELSEKEISELRMLFRSLSVKTKLKN